MDLNQHIVAAQQFTGSQQKLSMEQDNANKTSFALKMIERMPQQVAQAEPPRIPSLGALAVAN